MIRNHWIAPIESVDVLTGVLTDFLTRLAQARRDVREVTAINRHAVQLNAEMSDALSFQEKLADE